MSGTYEMVTVPQYELDTLRKQRDALAAALEMTAFELDSIIDQKGHTGLTRDVKDAAYKALALVKGGTSE